MGLHSECGAFVFINQALGGNIMFEEIERLTRALCAEHGTSGCEGDVFKVAKKELGFCKEVYENELGGVVGIFGDLSSKRCFNAPLTAHTVSPSLL